jgi:hypothetical protein
MAIFTRTTRAQVPVLAGTGTATEARIAQPFQHAQDYVEQDHAGRGVSSAVHGSYELVDKDLAGRGAPCIPSASLDAAPQVLHGQLRQAARRGAAEFARRFRTAIKRDQAEQMPVIPSSPLPQRDLSQGANTLEWGSDMEPYAASLASLPSPAVQRRSLARRIQYTNMMESPPAELSLSEHIPQASPAQWESIARRNGEMAQLNPQPGPQPPAHALKNIANANANAYVPFAFQEIPSFGTQAFAGPAEGMDVEALEHVVFEETPTNSSHDSTVTASMGSSGFIEQLAAALRRTGEFDSSAHAHEELASPPNSTSTDRDNYPYQDAVPTASPQVRGE